MWGNRTGVLVLILGLMLVACGGAAATTTTTAAAEATTTTTAAPTETSGPAISINDIPQECIDAFVGYLQALEPFLKGFDPATATMADFEAFGTELEPATATYTEASANAGCDKLNIDASDDATFQAIIEIAQREAPGTVAYWEWIRDLSATTQTSAASGDCETDVDALMVFVNRGGTMNDLTLAEVNEVSNVMTAIATECTNDRTTEVFADPKVTAFLGG